MANNAALKVIQEENEQKKLNKAAIKDRLSDLEDGLTAIEALTDQKVMTSFDASALNNSCGFIARTMRKCLMDIREEIGW